MPAYTAVLQKNGFSQSRYCWICGRIILMTGGLQCHGPCGAKCHRGYGKCRESCRMELLLKPCSRGLVKEKSKYSFGDLFRQFGRDTHSLVKETIVDQAMQEQRVLGKFDRLKELMETAQAMLESYELTALLCGCQIFMCVVICVSTFVVHLVWERWRGPQIWKLATLTTTSSIATLLLVQGVVCAAVRCGAKLVARYSAVAHTFVREILHIDLEDLKIDIADGACALRLAADRQLTVTMALWVIATASWTKAML